MKTVYVKYLARGDRMELNLGELPAVSRIKVKSPVECEYQFYISRVLRNWYPNIDIDLSIEEMFGKYIAGDPSIIIRDFCEYILNRSFASKRTDIANGNITIKNYKFGIDNIISISNQCANCNNGVPFKVSIYHDD
jgi:hypothetical protein